MQASCHYGDNHTYKNVEDLKESTFTFYWLFTQWNKNKCHRPQRILKENHSDIKGSLKNKIQWKNTSHAIVWLSGNCSSSFCRISSIPFKCTWAFANFFLACWNPWRIQPPAPGKSPYMKRILSRLRLLRLGSTFSLKTCLRICVFLILI